MITLASKTTGGGSFVSSVTVTNPSGLSVGDLMVVHLVALVGGGQSFNEWTVPSGWTRANTSYANNSVAGVGIRANLMWKVATSGDVSGGSASFTYAITALSYYDMMRFPVGCFNSSSPIDTSNSVSQSSAPGTWTPTCSITPTTINDFLLACIALDISTPSSISVVTSNPAWTLDYSSTNNTVFTATRPQTTSTGNPTIVSSGTSNVATLIFVALNNNTNQTFSLSSSIMNASSRFVTLVRTIMSMLSSNIMNASSRFTVLNITGQYIRYISDSIMNGASRFVTIIFFQPPIVFWSLIVVPSTKWILKKFGQ